MFDKILNYFDEMIHFVNELAGRNKEPYAEWTEWREIEMLMA